MIDAIAQWILRIIGAALISSAALSIAPEGGAKRALKLACGLLSAAALLSLALSFDYGAFSLEMEKMRSGFYEGRASGMEKAEKETRFIIESRLSEYILDKAEELGIKGVKASVLCEWSEEGLWYPVSVRLECGSSGKASERLEGYIESELGIPKERQIWSTGNEN